MTWFKVDDQFWGHPKQTALPKGAVALWVRAGSWSSDLLTDGFIPAHMLSMLGATKGDAGALVTAGLWESVEGGYQFHDWSVYQPTREHVEKKRDEDAERKAEWRRKRAAQKAAQSERPEDVTTGQARDSSVSHTSVTEASQACPTLPVPDPTRPDPDISKEMSSSSAGPRKRGHHLPDDFAPSEDLQRWARDRGFNDGQIAEMTDRFRDHWQSTPGAKGVKSNWDMAWRNWVGREDPARVRAVRATANGQRKWTNAELDAVLGADMWVQPDPPGHLDSDAKHVWWVAAINDHRAERIRQAEERERSA